jgi:hypothetical protein
MKTIMNDEYDRIWKEVVMACFGYHPSIHLGRLKKTMKNLGQFSW